MKVFAVVLLFLVAHSAGRPADETDAQNQAPADAPAEQADAVAPASASAEYSGSFESSEEEAGFGFGFAMPALNFLGGVVDSVMNTIANPAPAVQTVKNFYGANIQPYVQPYFKMAQDYYNQNVGPQVIYVGQVVVDYYNGYLQQHVSVLAQSAQQYITPFVDSLKPYIAATAQGAKDYLATLQTILQQQIQNVGPISLDLLANLVKSTIKFSVDNQIFDAPSGDRLFATVAGELATGEAYTEEDLDALQIDAQEGAANNFKSSVKALIALKQNGSATYVLLGGMEVALMRLLTAKSLVQAQAAASTMSAIGLSKMQAAFDLSLNYLVELKNQIMESQIVQQVIQKLPGAKDATLELMANLKNQIAQSQIVQQIVDQAPEYFNSSVNFVYALPSQVVQSGQQVVQYVGEKAPGLAAQYQQYMQDLTNQLAQSDLVQQVKQKAPEYYQPFLASLSQMANQIAQTQIAQQIAQKAPEYYTACINLLSGLKDQVFQNAPEIYSNLKTALLDKLAAGGQITKAGLVSALKGVLGLSANKYLLSEQDAARLAACFGIENNAEALKVEELETLVIKGNPQYADNLKASIKVALESVNANGVSLSNLASVNSALVMALTKNGLIDGATALGLNAIIGA